MPRDPLQELKTIKANIAALTRSLNFLTIALKDTEDQLTYTLKYLEKANEKVNRTRS